MPEATQLANGKLLVDWPTASVVRLTINNPAKRNALDHEMLDAIVTAVANATDARCLLITGTQTTFSGGYDITDIPSDVFAENAERLVAHPFAAALQALDSFPYPTVAALNGHAIGGGLELALTCDLRLAAANIKVGMPPAKLGLVYSHNGIARFIDAVGVPRTRELFLLGRSIPIDEALVWGLVNGVVTDHELAGTALDWASELAANAPLALSGNKRVIGEVAAAARRLSPDVERELIALREECFASQDFREGVRAFTEKRPPRWQGR